MDNVAKFKPHLEGLDKRAARIHAGQIWRSYGVKFESNGHTYSTEVYATSFEHAERIVKDMRATATVDGLNCGDFKA
jgi:hypothetical protein